MLQQEIHRVKLYPAVNGAEGAPRITGHASRWPGVNDGSKHQKLIPFMCAQIFCRGVGRGGGCQPAAKRHCGNRMCGGSQSPGMGGPTCMCCFPWTPVGGYSMERKSISI